MRVTFDSNVYVSALNYPGVPSRLLELAALEAFRLQLSMEILSETVRILADKFHWPNEDIIEVRAVLNSITDHVVPHVRVEVVERDSDDNRILECSQTSGSDYIVTGDKDLLDLKQYAGARIVRPAEFLAILQAH